MALELRLRPLAVADLDDIWAYTVATWSEAQAVRYLTRLDATLRLLTEHPELARLRTEFTPPLRLHPCQSHLILYRADDVALDVLRVVHRRIDWAVLLEE